MPRIQKVSDLHITGPLWTIEHVRTLDDCDRAEAAIIDALAKMDRDLTTERALTDPQWVSAVHRVKTLREKALEAVRNIRTELKFDIQAHWNAQALVVLQQLDPTCYAHVAAATNELVAPLLAQTQKAA